MKKIRLKKQKKKKITTKVYLKERKTVGRLLKSEIEGQLTDEPDIKRVVPGFKVIPPMDDREYPSRTSMLKDLKPFLEIVISAPCELTLLSTPTGRVVKSHHSLFRQMGM